MISHAPTALEVALRVTTKPGRKLPRMTVEALRRALTGLETLLEAKVTCLFPVIQVHTDVFTPEQMIHVKPIDFVARPCVTYSSYQNGHHTARIATLFSQPKTPPLAENAINRIHAAEHSPRAAQISCERERERELTHGRRATA